MIMIEDNSLLIINSPFKPLHFALVYLYSYFLISWHFLLLFITTSSLSLPWFILWHLRTSFHQADHLNSPLLESQVLLVCHLYSCHSFLLWCLQLHVIFSFIWTMSFSISSSCTLPNVVSSFYISSVSTSSHGVGQCHNIAWYGFKKIRTHDLVSHGLKPYHYAIYCNTKNINSIYYFT